MTTSFSLGVSPAVTLPAVPTGMTERSSASPKAPLTLRTKKIPLPIVAASILTLGLNRSVTCWGASARRGVAGVLPATKNGIGLSA